MNRIPYTWLLKRRKVGSQSQFTKQQGMAVISMHQATATTHVSWYVIYRGVCGGILESHSFFLWRTKLTYGGIFYVLFTGKCDLIEVSSVYISTTETVFASYNHVNHTPISAATLSDFLRAPSIKENMIFMKFGMINNKTFAQGYSIVGHDVKHM